jgi:tRNA(adenine34) deaminase
VISRFMDRAVAVALETEAAGNLPIGCVITLDDRIIAEAGSTVLRPVYHPGRHAEQNALRRVPEALWPRASEMTVHSTLEPCTMCFGSLLLHGVGRVVFGALDTLGGAGCLLPHLPPYYAEGVGVPEWIGPVDPVRCDPLYHRVDLAFSEVPAGRRIPSPWRDDG